MSRELDLASIKALILDIDGTLLRGEQPMPGLAELFSFLRSKRIHFVVASNNATKSPVDYQRKLTRSGVSVEQEAILTAGVATADYLARELQNGAPLYVIGEAALLNALGDAGFVLRQNASQPVTAVVVGGDSTLTYEKLKYAALLLQQGARLIGTNPDVLCPSEEGLVPEAGTTLAALQAATGVEPTVIGKPARFLFELAVQRMGHKPAHTAVLGDRLETDILGGLRAGIKTILITTGVDNETTVIQKGIIPDGIVSGLKDLVDWWQKQLKEGIHEHS